MMSRCTFCILVCILSLHHYGVLLNWDGKELQRLYMYTEKLNVSGKVLKKCMNQANVCVTDPKDCDSIPSHGQDRFLNTSCRYHVTQKSFVCEWTFLNNVKAKTKNSFIFSQDEDFEHCPSIFTPVAAFNMNIISKDIIKKVEFISENYTVYINKIIQAPRPVIKSLNATATSLNVTWTKDLRYNTKCTIRYRCYATEQWTMKLLTVPEKEKYLLHVINDLKPFSQYSLAIACTGNYGLWSDWSEECHGMTLEAIPTAPPYVNYYVKPADSRSKLQKLILLWRALGIKEARGIILGYNVTYTPTKQPGLKRTIHTKDQKAILEVTAGIYDLTVMAYNTAGQSPLTSLQVNAGVSQSLPKVKGLWASSEALSLRIRWETATVNVSEFVIEWFTFGDVASQWKRLNGSTFSTVLTGHIKPQKIYIISVYSLYDNLCAPPETIKASLEYGTLLDIVYIQLVNMTKTSTTVQWVWREQSSATNVLQYRLVLRGENETKTLVIFPHQRQHSFHNLQTNAKYIVSIYGETKSGNFSKANIEFTTPLLESDEIIKAAVPILLLIVTFSIFSVLARTVFKDYFFPNIANPGQSLIGHWLLNPPYEKETVVNVMKLEDFSVKNQLIEKSLVHIEPQMSLDKECFEEDMIMSNMPLPNIYRKEHFDNSENSMTLPGFSDYVDLPLIHANFGYVENSEMKLC